eukprot:TRINITY_DN2525_c0_g1_i1.p1 TRINITY_DN2525_c0_g1~~TRINITY_DN2525_c0_g1_i1.p1  ORF type:complete len:232 (+),score=23.99 TRINITY_DN2525_c0_g1_i1:219-914(+)
MVVRTDTEKLLTALVVVGTNLSCIPLAINCIRRGLAYESIIGSCSAIASIMYHVGEIYFDTYWWKWGRMNPGQWHRLDNVFSILSFNALLFFLMENTNPTTIDILRWVSLAFTLYCQELSPWNIMCTVVPILLPLLLLIAKLLYNRKVPAWIKSTSFRIGLLLLVVAVFFFVRGLDDDNDYLRINHGLWHFFIGLSFYFLFHGVRMKKVEHTELPLFDMKSGFPKKEDKIG